MNRSFLKTIEAMQEKMRANRICWIVSVEAGGGDVSHPLVVRLQDSTIAKTSSGCLLIQHIDDGIEGCEMFSVCWLVIFLSSGVIFSLLKHLSLFSGPSHGLHLSPGRREKAKEMSERRQSQRQRQSKKREREEEDIEDGRLL
jgi:hypothetical protein